MSTAIASPAVPEGVLCRWVAGPNSVLIEQLAGGEINQTYLVMDQDPDGNRRKMILQKLAPFFGKLVLEDTAVIGEALTAQGWEVPRVIPTNDGELGIEHPGLDEKGQEKTFVWRATTFIESDGPIRVDTADQCAAFGNLLARLHHSLAQIEGYRPKHEISHFHDTPYYLGTLREYAAGERLPSAQTQRVSETLLVAYDNLQPLPETKKQIVQGDPRPDNVLRRGDKPYTFIDPDTMMWGTIWIDLGDAMRSMAEASLLRTGEPLDVNLLRAFAEGYRQQRMPDTDADEFFKWALTAMETIAIELSSRYMIDTVEDYYFDWDRTKYSSREENHLARVETQLQIYNAYHHLIQEDKEK